MESSEADRKYRGNSEIRFSKEPLGQRHKTKRQSYQTPGAQVPRQRRESEAIKGDTTAVRDTVERERLGEPTP